MSYLSLIKFIEVYEDRIYAETESYIEFRYKCKVSELDNSLFAKTTDFLFEDFGIIMDDCEIPYEDLDTFKASYDDEGEENKYLLINDEVTCKGKINKKLLTDYLPMKNSFIFTSILSFKENMNFLSINDSTKKTFVGIINCSGEIFNSGFIIIKSAKLLSMIDGEEILPEDIGLFEASNSLYLGKEFNNYLEFPNTWYPKYISGENNEFLDFIYTKQVESFFYFICNKKTSENTFLIRGYKVFFYR
ncbi:hypothetical protein [Enterococcus durans]|uniref:hypothetical protein n=1 Tax=Enterococcus durans TaxID=53345 RepID=UPI003EBABED2